MRCLLLRPCAKRSYLHDEEFQESDESKDLQSSWDGDRERSIPSRSKIRELGTGIVDITREVHATLVDKVAHNTKHTDASVLDFDIAKAIKLFLVSVGNESKRIKESKLKRARIKNQQSQTKRRGEAEEPKSGQRISKCQSVEASGEAEQPKSKHENSRVAGHQEHPRRPSRRWRWKPAWQGQRQRQPKQKWRAKRASWSVVVVRLDTCGDCGGFPFVNRKIVKDTFNEPQSPYPILAESISCIRTDVHFLNEMFCCRRRSKKQELHP